MGEGEEKMEFETILDLDGIEFTVRGFYTPQERAIWRHGILEEPEIPDDVDLVGISLGGEDLTQGQEDALIQGYGYKEFCSWLLDEGRRLFKEEIEDNRINALI